MTGQQLCEHVVSDLPDSPADGTLPDVLGETGFAAPTVTTNGRQVAAIFAIGELVCVSMTGKRIWAKHLGTPINHYGHASSLLCDGDLLIVQYDQKNDAKLFAFDMATGEPSWQWDEALPDSASPLAAKEFLIVPTAFGVVTCLNARSGEVCWEHEFNQGFCSSPILVHDRVYIIDLSGNTHVFRLDEKFELLGESDIGEPAYATPAFVGARIIIRGSAHLFCIDETDQLPK